MKALEGLTGDTKKNDHWQALEHWYSTLWLCSLTQWRQAGQDRNHSRQGHQGPHKWLRHWAETSTLQLWIMIHTPLVIPTLLTPGFLANVRPSVDANTNLQEAFALFPEDCRLTENHGLQSPNHILISHSRGLLHAQLPLGLHSHWHWMSGTQSLTPSLIFNLGLSCPLHLRWTHFSNILPMVLDPVQPKSGW